MKCNLIIALLINVAVISCTVSTENEKSTNDRSFKINLEESLNQTEFVPLSEIGRSIKYIPLETNPSSLLTNIRNVTLCDSFIFVCDIHKLLQFDSQGRFIRQIGSKGRGPGEYSGVWDFCIDESKKLIYIPFTGESKILVFDFNGSFLHSFKLPFKPMNLVKIDTNLLMFHLNNLPHPKSDTSYSWFITDLDGNAMMKIKNLTKRERMPGYGVPETPLYMFKETPHFMEFGIDTLYSLNGLSKEPYAIFDFGQLKMDADPDILNNQLIEEYNEKYWILSMLEDEKNIYINIVQGLGGPYLKGTFNKQDSIIKILEGSGFENDIDNGLSFWPKEIIHDTILIDFVNGYQLLTYLNQNWQKFSPDERDSFQVLKESLSETSNPVLIFVD